MKKIWVVSLGVVSVIVLYSVILFVFKMNPLTAIKAILNGHKANFSPIFFFFIFITLLYYAIILPKVFIKENKNKKANIFYKNVNNINKNTSSKINPSKKTAVLGAIQVEQDLENTADRLANLVKQHEVSNKVIDTSKEVDIVPNEFDLRAKELESNLNNTYNINTAVVQDDVTSNIVKKQPIVITLLKEEQPYDYSPLFLHEVNAKQEPENITIGNKSTANSLQTIREQLEIEEKSNLEVIKIDTPDSISDVEALALAEALEEGNTLFTEKTLQNKKKVVFSALDTLNTIAGLGDILNDKEEQ